ncbi:ABC1 kinase family protein [Paramicrobacterium chengjingii]|uniref:AarF/ABC1/UbiB kinase family protein n=1 Tax=Paramicrobacterium chengjingii TaxID=2769067 RepID=A0ABX6YK46_9MICO|nr:AarF/UbiB family protein [Microbacterium chengjingii]QPZ38776.1 AarF/ABC1/UbiB kinase family protein [Microbacterium chengjingii]
MGTVVVDVVVLGAITVVFMFVLSAFATRILDVRIGIIRLGIAGILGLGAQIGFESQFVWGNANYTPALIPLQVGIVFFVAIAFLVIAELIVPAGTVPRPDQWWPAIVGGAQRSRRYTEISRIALRSGLLPFRPNLDSSLTGHNERMRQAAALRVALESAGGAFVKFGQMLSTRGDLLPAEFLDELSALQQSVLPAEWDDVRQLLEAEWGAPLEQVVESFEAEPLASASIGQVHRARLRDGRDVAVKVQRPGVMPLIERDIDIAVRLATKLERTAAWARDMGMLSVARDFSTSLQSELDYRIEASNMSAMRITQRKHPTDERVGVPEHMPELCTGKVLVMELINGDTLSTPQARDARSDVRRQRLASRLLRSTLVQIIDDGVFHSDLHPGNIVLTPNDDIVLLDYGLVGRLDSFMRAQIGAVLFAFYRGDSQAFTDALLGFVDMPDDIDEPALRRKIGAFVATRLGPGATLDVGVFNEMVQLLTVSRIAVPLELASAFRAVATLEGTLRVLTPSFDLLTEASDYARERIDAGFSPQAAFTNVKSELESMLPMLRRLPARVDKVSGDLADGRLTVNIRLFADKRERRLVTNLVNLAAVTFLAGALGMMAVILLVTEAGPRITETLTLFQIFGYLLVVLAGLLTLRVVFDAFRIRRRE